MAKIDRLGWAAGISVNAYGVRVGVRANTPEALESLTEHLPPGWERSTSPTVDQMYSLIAGGPEPRPPHPALPPAVRGPDAAGSDARVDRGGGTVRRRPATLHRRDGARPPVRARRRGGLAGQSDPAAGAQPQREKYAGHGAAAGRGDVLFRRVRRPGRAGPRASLPPPPVAAARERGVAAPASCGDLGRKPRRRSLARRPRRGDQIRAGQALAAAVAVPRTGGPRAAGAYGAGAAPARGRVVAAPARRGGGARSERVSRPAEEPAAPLLACVGDF
jgi:hypothetical protein